MTHSISTKTKRFWLRGGGGDYTVQGDDERLNQLVIGYLTTTCSIYGTDSQSGSDPVIGRTCRVRDLMLFWHSVGTMTWFTVIVDTELMLEL